MKKQLFLSLGILSFLAVATVLVIIYGEGYRFGFGNGRPEVLGTGLLVATSTPDGAQVFINDHLTTATNNTINLFPGTYTVRIFKDGYFPWQKKIVVQKEVVAKAEALLFPTTPKLESITQTGVINPVMDPSMTKIAFTVASQSARKNGIYVFDVGNHSLISLSGGITQITDDTVDTFSQAQLSWSPDGKNLLATVSAAAKTPTTYLLDATGFNATPKDVSETLATVNDSWNKLTATQTKAQMDALKKPLAAFLSTHTKILALSPDETKILYMATDSAALSQIIKPALIGTDSTPEERNVQPGTVYVYDIKEDKNFAIAQQKDGILPQLMWYPDSMHLIFAHDKRIDMMEYDGGNDTIIYAGPFTQQYVFPDPTGASIIVLTNLNNPDIQPNLYTISLR
ncbi:MAG TPA: PEGA domain-containing protein [Patescibacteria group bacterium]|nr:PEGA domain-containing protein [Patescibacteria group bacterium]